MDRRRLLKALGLGALVGIPSGVSAQSTSQGPMSRVHPVSVLRRVASFQLAHFQKFGTYDGVAHVFGADADRVPDDHPLKGAFLQGQGFDKFGLDVRFVLGPDKRSYWMTAGPGQAPSRFFVDEKNVIYRSTDDTRWNATDLSQLSPRDRSWTPITKAEFETKSAKAGGVFATLASVLNTVVPVVEARAGHGDCCHDDFPGWWWSCWNTDTSWYCADSWMCDCSNGYYFCVQGFQDCMGCCVNCDGNCDCVWDQCPGS
jgi:hypothetical protein